METRPACGLVDAMSRLPAKLDGLLRDGHMLPKGAEDEIPLIKRDLQKMIAKDHGNSSSMMVRCLVKEGRELSYDMEDCIDRYELAADASRSGFSIIPRRRRRSGNITRRRHGRTSSTARLPEKLKLRLWMANKIREFSVRSQEALRRYFDHGGSSSTAPGRDASLGSWRRPQRRGELAGRPVGIDGPVSKLEPWLRPGKDVDDGGHKLKVVSIVGPGGVGKTTLADELYRRTGAQFQCRAFLRTSRKPDIRRVLISMLSQLVLPHHELIHNWKVHSLIAHIKTHLQDKRYLIVIEDVWATSTWDIVNGALPDGDRGSRIIITTEIEDVALYCCGYDPKYVFKMKPLGEDDSRKLFYSTVVVPPELSEVSNRIIKKCGGLPLATVTIASLLASQMGKPEEWDYVDKSLGYNLRTNPTLEGMTQVLNLCYNNLPQHLKACMLYFSIYQEDYIIWKDELVKQWMAEGFVCANEEKDEEEISRSYFDDLISSRMIQAVHINDKDEVLSCTVHHMVLNFITQRSIEENFVTAIDHSQTSTRLADKIRRLSLHYGNAEDATPPANMRLSQVRTLAFFGVFKCMPAFVEFRLLQVLILNIWGDEESVSLDITKISDLFRLRYLQVTCNVTLKLRSQPQTRPGVQYLPRLLHLNLPSGTNLPDGMIAHMTSLRTLGCFDLSSNSSESVQSLGELTDLQDLQLTVRPGNPENNNGMQCLGSILGKLSNLKSVTLVPAGCGGSGTSVAISGDGMSSSPPALLRRLALSPRVCVFSRLPDWIGHLTRLCVLKIAVSELARNDVHLLGGLPALTVMSLSVGRNPAERIVFDKGGFLLLRYFKFKLRCSGVPRLKFEAGAAPSLRKLKLSFSAPGPGVELRHAAAPISIEYLSGLEEISAKISGAPGDDARSALTTAIRNHPRNPRIDVQLVDRGFYGDESTSVGTAEQQHWNPELRDEILEEDADECYGTQGEDENKQADSRASTLSQSSSCTTVPGNPRIGMQSMDYVSYDDTSKTLEQQDEIMEEDPEKYYRTEDEDTEEDENTPTDSGITMLSESSSSPLVPGLPKLNFKNKDTEEDENTPADSGITMLSESSSSPPVPATAFLIERDPSTVGQLVLVSPPPPPSAPVPAAGLSRYESKKRRDWNMFLQYLRNHKPPLTLQRCTGAHGIKFLNYLDRFGKTKVHAHGCAYFGQPNPPAPCPCPLRQAWGKLDALVSRLRAAYEEQAGLGPESNPFASRALRSYLRGVRDAQAKARGITDEQKKRKNRDRGSTAPSPTVTMEKPECGDVEDD